MKIFSTHWNVLWLSTFDYVNALHQWLKVADSSRARLNQFYGDWQRGESIIFSAELLLFHSCSCPVFIISINPIQHFWKTTVCIFPSVKTNEKKLKKRCKNNIFLFECHINQATTSNQFKDKERKSEKRREKIIIFWIVGWYHLRAASLQTSLCWKFWASKLEEKKGWKRNTSQVKDQRHPRFC